MPTFRLQPFIIWYRIICSISGTAIIKERVAQTKHRFAKKPVFFRDKTLWTKQIQSLGLNLPAQCCMLVFSNNSDNKIEPSENLQVCVWFSASQQVYTTEAHQYPRKFPLFPLWSSSTCSVLLQERRPRIQVTTMVLWVWRPFPDRTTNFHPCNQCQPLTIMFWSKGRVGQRQAPAAKQKGPYHTPQWKEYNWWSHSDHKDAE